MKRILFAIMITLIASSAYAADVGVSVSVGQPGFYGRIDIGNYPQPELIYTRPVVVRPVPAGVVYQPVYVRVPPGHAKNWSRYCDRYNACGRPVYFVRDRWYKDVYVPQHHARVERYGRDHQGDNHGHDRGHN